MSTPNYEVNYDDKRFTEVEADKKAALNEVDVTYGNMISQSDNYFQKQIDAAQDYADKQSQIQQQQTDFAIEQIEQQKEQAKQDYTKEQSGAYVDWQKQSNEYGANAEAMAAQGMTNTGYSESSQVSMYNTYQNRVATARESYNRAVLNYDNAIKEARLQNNAALAEIAYNALQTQLELSLEGFQYKNDLIIQKANKKTEVDNTYHNRYMDVLNQINTENKLAEEVRQFEAEYAEKKRQFDEEIARLKAKDAQENKLAIQELELKKKQLEEEKRQFNEQMAEEKRQFDSKNNSAAIVKSSGSGGTKKGTKKVYSSDKYANISKDAKAAAEKNNTRNVKAEPTVTNRHGDSWVEIPGHGRFSWSEVYTYVKSGQIKETEDKNGNLTYRWVTKTAKNVTPDAKGYAAKQKDLMGF